MFMTALLGLGDEHKNDSTVINQEWMCAATMVPCSNSLTVINMESANTTRQ